MRDPGRRVRGLAVASIAALLLIRCSDESGVGPSTPGAGGMRSTTTTSATSTGDGAGGSSGGGAGSAGAAGSSGIGGGDASLGGDGDAATDASTMTMSDARADAQDSGDAAAPRHPFQWTGIVGTGQSLSVGANGTPLLATTRLYNNLVLSIGSAKVPPFDSNLPGLTMAPLVEPIRPLAASYPGAYPANIFGETPHTSMANQISAIHAKAGLGDYTTVHSVVGESGQSITVIGKDATPTVNTGLAYAATLFEARAIQRLAQATGKTFGIGAIVLTHGETDSQSATYQADIRKLATDYNADLRPITGQSSPIVLILTQQNSIPGAGSRSISTLAAWRLGVDYPQDFVCAGPKYQYSYTADLVHLTAHEYDRLGEKYGEVYYERVVLGRPWQPLQPTAATRAGNVITVSFHVPVPPLDWDDSLAPPFQTTFTEWAKGRGFEVEDAGGRVPIDSVAIQGSTVLINLQAPPKNNLVVRYAMSHEGVAGSMIFPRRGQLRDSDAFVGIDAETISCQVTTGSAVIRAAAALGFHRRGPRDLVSATGLAQNTIVAAQPSDVDETLSQPWMGGTGTAALQFRSDHRNYCVAFEMAVP